MKKLALDKLKIILMFLLLDFIASHINLLHIKIDYIVGYIQVKHSKRIQLKEVRMGRIIVFLSNLYQRT